MAIIGTLRNKMGMWVAVFIFVAIAAFILNDLLGKTSMLLGHNNVGTIGGSNISLSEYQDAVKQRENNYIMQFNREPGEREMVSLRQQAWDYLIAKYTVQPQYKKVGIEVTQDEVWDMIQGKNVDASLKQAFTNPKTGQFDRDIVVNYLQQLNGAPPTDQRQLAVWQEERARWDIFQKDLQPSRERLKYENLLIKTNYITSAEAEHEYHVENDVSEVNYLYVPYFSMNDSTVKVTQADLQHYYDENEKKFKTEHTKDMDYVRFPVVPSSQDSAEVKDDIMKIKADFTKAADDSTFASINSDSRDNFFESYSLATLPATYNVDSLEVGKIVGPYVDEGAYKMYKTTAIAKDTAYSVQARHILIKWDNDTPQAKASAKAKAEQIIKELKAGADFAATARKESQDPGSAQQGGDLGWFKEGDMVKPFQEAAFGATHTGVIDHPVESQFGYHIIDVTHTKDNRLFKIAIITKELSPSDATINEALRKAELFAADIHSVDDFTKKADHDGVNVLTAEGVKSSDRNVGLLSDARRVVQWLFRDAKTGDLSDVFDLQDEYVVAIATGETDEGFKPLNEVKDEITPAVRNDLKGKAIVGKLSKLSGSLDEVAKAYGDGAKVYTASDAKMSSNSLPGINFAPQTIGLAFSLKDGERSKPFAGENGVVIVEMQHKTIAPDIADYSIYKTQMAQKNNANVTSYNISEAVQDAAGIDDKRYRFY